MAKRKLQWEFRLQKDEQIKQTANISQSIMEGSKAFYTNRLRRIQYLKAIFCARTWANVQNNSVISNDGYEAELASQATVRIWDTQKRIWTRSQFPLTGYLSHQFFSDQEAWYESTLYILHAHIVYKQSKLCRVLMTDSVTHPSFAVCLKYWAEKPL